MNLELSNILLLFIPFILGLLVMYFLLKNTTANKSELNYETREREKLEALLNEEKKMSLKLEAENRNLEIDFNKEQNAKENAEKNVYELKQKIDSLVLNEKQLIEDKLSLEKMISSLQLQNEYLESQLNEQKTELEKIRERSLQEFENIANKIFDDKSTRFSKLSKENLEQLLNPLKENIADFKKKVEETYDKESKERFSLEAKIQDLIKLNQQISKDADNLTRALKGESKTQGNWGEMILESILEYSGLIKNVQYFTQESFKDEKGKRKQPDIMIKYPDDRFIIIDSKVSLTAYERFASSEDIDEQKQHLKEHIKSIKKHIDDLSSKEYENFDKALDFVFLFIPIEPAFLTALKNDSELWNYAYKKRIVIISPTNLIATLKVIADVWSKEQQNTNAREISRRGQLLFEKFVGFVDDMDGIEKHLGKASEKFDDAMNKLSTGRGNLIGQAENLKNLGIDAKKSLPEKYLLDNVELDKDNETE